MNIHWRVYKKIDRKLEKNQENRNIFFKKGPGNYSPLSSSYIF